LYLLHSRHIPPEKIVFFGRSLGGAIATWLAQNHNPGALIIESSFTSVPELAAELYPHFPVQLLCRYRYNTADYITKISCPLLIIHNVNDELVLIKHGQTLFEIAHKPKEFLKTIGSHNELDVVSREKYEESINSFILRFLPNLD